MILFLFSQYLVNSLINLRILFLKKIYLSDSLADKLLSILLNKFHHFVSYDTNDSSKRNKFALQHSNEFFHTALHFPNY